MAERENKNYIASRVHPIFEKMVVDLLLVKPDDLVEYMIGWLQDKGSQFRQTQGAANHNPSLRELPTAQRPGEDVSVSKSDDEEDEDEEHWEEEEKLRERRIQSKQFKKTRRMSVSAEAVNKKITLPSKIAAKRHETKERLNKKINSLFIFSCLEEKERALLIDILEERRLRPGEFLFRLGDPAEHMYFVESGLLDSYSKQGDTIEPIFIRSFTVGESFGELALLYNRIRLTSVASKNDSVVWQLDRSAYYYLVHESAQTKIKRYKAFFQQIPLLQVLNTEEQNKLMDAIRYLKYAKGEYVVRQGDQGDMFYQVEEGELVALKVKTPGGEPEQVMNYKAGQHFGELALVKTQPRQASIICKTNCKILALDRYSFQRLLGPAEAILKRIDPKKLNQEHAL